MKSMRADIVIAVLALLISTGATLSSLYQTKVIARQLSASVWPYLSVSASIAPDRYSLQVQNDGLGPALIRTVALSVDGRRVASYGDALRAVIRKTPLHHMTAREDFTGIGPDSVIRPGETLALITASSPAIARLGELDTRVTLELCYCSLLDQCWHVDSKDRGAPQVAVASCAPSKWIEF